MNNIDDRKTLKNELFDTISEILESHDIDVLAYDDYGFSTSKSIEDFIEIMLDTLETDGFNCETKSDEEDDSEESEDGLSIRDNLDWEVE